MPTSKDFTKYMGVLSNLFRNVKNYSNLEFFIVFKTQKRRKIPAGKCDSYTRMLQMNPPDDWLETG